MNYGKIDVDDCGVPSTSEDITVNDEFCKFQKWGYQIANLQN